MHVPAMTNPCFLGTVRKPNEPKYQDVSRQCQLSALSQLLEVVSSLVAVAFIFMSVTLNATYDSRGIDN